MCSITRRLPLSDPVAGYSDPAWLTITAPGLIAAIPERLNLRALDPRSNASFDPTTVGESLMQPNYALERARGCSFGEARCVGVLDEVPSLQSGNVARRSPQPLGVTPSAFA
jgi:hypothetical protein